MGSSVWYITFAEKKLQLKKYPAKKYPEKIKKKEQKKKSAEKSEGKKKNNSVNLVLFFGAVFAFMIFLLGFVSAITDDLHLNLQTTDSSGNVQSGTFNFTFNISTSSNCSDMSKVVYTNETQLTTDNRGILSVYLPSVSLDYDSQYYLCYSRFNTDGSLNRSDNFKLARVPYAFKATDLNLSDIDVDSNLNMADYNITDVNYGFFDYLGSLANRITSIFVGNINATGNIETESNVSADWFLGKINASDVQNDNWIEDSQEGDLNVNGSDYWDNLDSPDDIDFSTRNVNSSDYWDGLDTFNASELEQQSDGNLGILDSFINLLIDNRVTQAFVKNLGFYNTTQADDAFVDVSGDTMTGTLDMGDNAITNIDWASSDDGPGSELDADYLDGYDSSFFMPLNTSVSGDFDFNGGWQSGGLSIQDGDIYAQTGYFYNITSLNVTKQDLTIVDDLIVYGNTDLRQNLTVDTNTFFVDSNSNLVGIGTTSPNSKLEVAGTFNSTNNGGSMKVDSNGNVKIGI